MPDIVMHHHFGKVVYSAIDENVKKEITNTKLYDFATGGPDPFFFCNFINSKLQKESNAFGDYMHRHKTKEFFTKLIELSKVDYNMFNYLCGFVTHYYLDLYTHPYIFHCTGLYKVEDIDTLCYRGLHTKLERAMDCYVIENYYDANPNKFNITNKILKLRKINKSSKESFDRLYKSVYDKDNGYKMVNNSIKWERRFYRFIFDPFGLISKILTKKDDGKSKLDYTVLSYYNRSIPTTSIDIFNFKKKTWCNPADKEMSYNYGFFDLFDQAKDKAVNCINDLYKTIFLNESFDLDYYFKDLSYITGLPCSYDLEMKYFNNIFEEKN